MYKSTPKPKKKNNNTLISKFSFPSPTLKTNIVLNIENKEINGMRTSLSGEAKILLIFGIVSLA